MWTTRPFVTFVFETQELVQSSFKTMHMHITFWLCFVKQFFWKLLYLTDSNFVKRKWKPTRPNFQWEKSWRNGPNSKQFYPKEVLQGRFSSDNLTSELKPISTFFVKISHFFNFSQTFVFTNFEFIQSFL